MIDPRPSVKKNSKRREHQSPKSKKGTPPRKTVEGLPLRSKVEAKFSDRNAWFEGEITGKKKDGSYDILAEAGFREQNVSPENVHALDRSSPKHIRSPRYCPPPIPDGSTKKQQRRYPRSPPKQVYTTFSQAKRFQWQKPKSGPSPSSYNVPTAFSPFTAPPPRPVNKTMKKKTTNSVSKKLQLNDTRSPSTSSSMSMSSFRSPQTNRNGASAHSGDEVTDFVKSSVRGSSFKVWETSPKEWTDKTGYSHTGRWVTVHGSSTGAKKISNRKGMEYMLKMQGMSYDERNLDRIFDTIDADGDQHVTGKELRMFLANERDTSAGKALIKYMKRARVVHDGGSLFAAFDKNHDQTISRSEFKATLMDSEEKRILEALFDEIDVNKDGTITAQELVEFMSEENDGVKIDRRLELQKYVFEGRRVFLATRNVFEGTSDEQEETVGRSEQMKIFKALDLNDDGEITKHEFVRGLEKGVRHIRRDARAEPVLTVSSNSEKLREIFRFYCNFGDRFKDLMSVTSFTKMIRECDLKNPKPKRDMLIDSTNLTLGDLGIIFNRAARYQTTHMKRGTQEWVDVMREAQKRFTSHSRIKYRINFETMLYALRLVCKKRWPKSDRSKSEQSSAMKKLLVSHILPLYDEDISHSHSTYTKMKASFQQNIKKYKQDFLDAVNSDGDPVGGNVFFREHHRGLKSIFDRYASLDAPTADNKNQELEFLATSSWKDVQETNQTMDWLEFTAFIQDFDIVPKLTSRLVCEQVFIYFSTNDFQWHDKDGHVVMKDGNIAMASLRLDGFKHCLGFLSMTLFQKDYLESQCPTPKSKLELLFFKMSRPKWLLAAAEKRMTKRIDISVKKTIAKDVEETNLQKFKAPRKQIEEVKSLLDSLAMEDDEDAVFDKTDDY